MLNSISNFKAWQQPIAKDYKAAVQEFESDLAHIKAYDVDHCTFGAYPSDTDFRKGEVQVAGQGSLHSTEAGFHLRTEQAESKYLNLGAQSKRQSGSRDYQVDSQKGTITVTNNVGAFWAVNAWGGSQESGHTEKYVIDTVNGTIADYSKKDSGLAWGTGAMAGVLLPRPAPGEVGAVLYNLRNS